MPLGVDSLPVLNAFLNAVSALLLAGGHGFEPALTVLQAHERHMSRDSQSDDGLASPRPEGKSMLSRGKPVAAAGSAVRAGGFPETFSLKDPIPANEAWEEFDAKASGVR